MPKQVVSERKRQANRANALKSTGPNTEEGRRISRMNAVVHGMRAEMVVLATENAAEFEAERLGWIEDWNPQSQTRMALVERAAAQSWRLRRCVRVETARLTSIAYQTGIKYDRELETRLARGLRLLETNPRAGLDALSNDPSGIEVLIGMWTKLEDALSSPEGWDDYEEFHAPMMRLLGFHAETPPEHVNEGTIASMRLLKANHNELEEGDECDEAEKYRIAANLQSWFRKFSSDLIRSLEKYLDPGVIRRREIEAQCIDDSPAGKALHRYEATHDRAFRASINQLMQMAKTGCDLIAPNEATEDASPCEEAPCNPESSGPTPPKPPREPRPEADAPNEATEEPSRAVDRDREGRIWAVEGDDPGSTER